MPVWPRRIQPSPHRGKCTTPAVPVLHRYGYPARYRRPGKVRGRGSDMGLFALGNYLLILDYVESGGSKRLSFLTYRIPRWSLASGSPKARPVGGRTINYGVTRWPAPTIKP